MVDHILRTNADDIVDIGRAIGKLEASAERTLPACSLRECSLLFCLGGRGGRACAVRWVLHWALPPGTWALHTHAPALPAQAAAREERHALKQKGANKKGRLSKGGAAGGSGKAAGGKGGGKKAGGKAGAGKAGGGKAGGKGGGKAGKGKR